MPPLLLPLLGVIAVMLGLFGKRGGAIIGGLMENDRESSGTKTEIHNHYYRQSGPRAEEETGARPSDAPEPRVRRRMRRDPPRVLDLNPYEETEDEAQGEREVKP